MKISVNIKKTYQEQQFEPVSIEVGLEEECSVEFTQDLTKKIDAMSIIIQERIEEIYEKRQKENKAKNTFKRGKF